MVNLTDADICNVIRAERKAATDESQKTIHILTEQREDYRKQVVFLEGQVNGLRSQNDKTPPAFFDELALEVAHDVFNMMNDYEFLSAPESMQKARLQTLVLMALSKVASS